MIFCRKDTVKWQYVESVLRELALCYGFEELRTPIFESTELFLRGVGETTDIVNKEMYTFEDKGGRSITLRPEGTASSARALIEHKLYGGPLPVKLWYTGPMFRYERPQKGRFPPVPSIRCRGFRFPGSRFRCRGYLLCHEFLRNIGFARFRSATK